MYRVNYHVIRCAPLSAFFAICALLTIGLAGCVGGGSSQSGTLGGPGPITSVGLTHYWNADGVFADSSGTSNGTPVGGVTFSPGISGQAFHFNGVDQYIDIPDLVAFNSHADTDRMTVGGWFFIDPNAASNVGDLAMLISKSNGGTVGGGWFLTFDDRGVPADYPPGFSPPFSKSIWFAGSNTNGIYGGDHVIARKDNAITAAGWYHIMVTFDPSATPEVVLYINGLPTADSGQSHIPFITNNGMTGRIGAAHSNEFGGKEDDRFNGMADEIRNYNRALTAAEIKATFNAGAPSAGLPTVP